SSFGLIGALIAWGLSLALDMRLLYIGMRTRKGKNKYIIAGLVGILAFQQIENMGMIIGLLPITGITLPFISAGGSSLLSYMIIFALVFQMFNDFEKKENNL
ncbi:MAG: FtsW/RodA/SpoVE family cell cycle protein, partial [Erysipelotrichales bacterium]|nr:FtsW/RodA/SpoVE family cell cycle protein [Erysipelotrichales bacterium]